MKEQSYVMIKPGFANHTFVIDEVVNRLKKANLKIKKAGYIHYDSKTAKEHYHEHIDKDFYPVLEEYILSDKAYGMIVEGENAISTIRKLAGSTKEPAEGTIRYDIPKMLGIERNITKNVVHSSDSAEASKLEISIFEKLFEKQREK